MARTQRDRTAATTSKLIAAARNLFANHGYAATLLDDVVRDAGVTTGALYHHFPNKLELFAAVYEQEQQRLAELSITAHSARQDDEDGLEAGFRAFLEASRDPGVQRITLLDAPSVLGWERLRAIEGRYTIAMLRVALEQAVATGLFDDRPIEPLVQMLNGALCEASLLIARSEHQEEVTEQVLFELRMWLGVLRRRTAVI
jgi:AcrR family transcriptional regulator